VSHKTGNGAPDRPLGGIATILVEEQLLREEQVRYALRIQSRLKPPRPLLQVLKELGYVDDAGIRSALASRRLDVRVGELLVELGVVSEDDLAQALRIQGEDPASKARLGDVLLEHGFVEERALYETLAYQLGYEFLEPRSADIPAQLVERAPPAWCRSHRFLPLRREGEQVVVAFADPTDRDALEAAAQVFGREAVRPVLATPSAIDETWQRRLEARAEARTGELPEDQAADRIVDEILHAAIERDASDIHIEPSADRLRIRLRVDGMLVPLRELPLGRAAAITSRIKVMARADIAERRRHQGGRISYTHEGRDLDLRVSFYVTVHGEKTVLRILNRDLPLLAIEETGMPPRILERFIEDALERPSGVVLVTGPTGSGKTTTLYSCVHHINSPDTAIITAEDPVEYMIDGIAQCSLNPEIELTFDETLRHIVRQDPDVIVIGEIRDRFSAEAAIQAALTGHKVITTFHTEDTIGGLIRLLNMNIEAFLVSSTVVSVLAQRLLRRVCEDCAVPYEPTAADLRRLGYVGGQLEGAQMRIGRGCSRCSRTGHKGRLAVFELLVLGEEIRDAILEHRTSHEIRRISRQSNGMVSLLEDGIVKAARGLTTVREIVRMLPRLDKPRPLPELRRLVGDA